MTIWKPCKWIEKFKKILPLLTSAKIHSIHALSFTLPLFARNLAKVFYTIPPWMSTLFSFEKLVQINGKPFQVLHVSLRSQFWLNIYHCQVASPWLNLSSVLLYVFTKYVWLKSLIDKKVKNGSKCFYWNSKWI